MATLGRPEWVGANPEEMIAIARRLASDPRELAAIRSLEDLDRVGAGAPRELTLYWKRSNGDSGNVALPGASFFVRETMAALEQQLPQEKFIRINRSALVNLDHVKELQPLRDEDHALVLKSGEVLEMTRGVREVEHWLKYTA